MSLLDLFRKKGPAPATGEPALAPQPATPLPAPPLPGAIPVSSPSAAETATNLSAAENVAVAAAQEASAPEEPGLRAYDEFGREVYIPASQWRRELLPHALQQVHNNPDALSAILLDALQAGAAAEILPSATHLQSIDPVPERGASMHGLVLLANGKAAEAEDVFITYLGQYGPSATILTHLARAQAAQNRIDEADATLWRALEANPNEDGAVTLYAARSREREGEFGWQAALERAATLPGAWLALMLLGRSALEGRNRSLAVALYKQAIERAGQPSPTLLLQGVSGDLGQFGLVDDLLRLVRPNFSPELHGLAVGGNLMRALLDSNESAEALALVRELGKLNRPELAEPLRAWEVEIRRRDLMAHAAQNPPQPQLLRIDGPVWLPPSTPGRTLYATAGARRAAVLFLGSSASLPQELPAEVAAMLPDTVGRLSRALPLFLAENAFSLLTFDTQTMVPYAEIAGFAMLQQPWPDDAAAAYARDSGAAAAVSTHIEATPEGGTITVRLLPAAAAVAASAEADGDIPLEGSAADAEAAVADRPAEPSLDGPSLTANPSEFAQGDGDQPAAVAAFTEPVSVSIPFTWPELHVAAQSVWPQLAIHLVTALGDTPEPPRPGRYTPPRGLELNIYMRLLEQLLAINCAAGSRNGPYLVTGERETLRTALDLAIRNPNSLPVRLMLGEVLLRLRALHPEVLGEFLQPLRLLNERHPFPDGEAASILQAQQAAALGQQQQPTAQA
jgi:tetratricopeptide (TPR) repeat protein